ncbi:hypothetical protein MMC10_006395 [Thelotrema lepadinum]|nr:hypothetical protein [Thelotrema lepadinum]
MGKVHGSLARAGKVKSQTPKVESAEKAKVPKGRARKRVVYTRRFVNMATTGGGKRRALDNGAICLTEPLDGGTAADRAADLDVITTGIKISIYQLELGMKVGLVQRIKEKTSIPKRDEAAAEFEEES